MPKPLSAAEREITKQSLYRAGLGLIKSKRLRHVTVDDITKAAGIAKGSFYLYYRSKEELLYEIFYISTNKIFEAILNFRSSGERFKCDIENLLYNIYLSSDSIALYIQPEDLEYIKRKCPDKAKDIDDNRRKNNFTQTMMLFGLSETDMGTLAYLMDCLQYMATRPSEYREASHQQCLKVQIHAIAEFVDKRATKKIVGGGIL